MSGGQDVPNMMWPDEEAFRRQVHLQQQLLHQQQQQHQHHQQQQHQQLHPHNMQHFNAASLGGGGGSDVHPHLHDVHNANSLYNGSPLQLHAQQHPGGASSSSTSVADHLYSMLPMGNGNYLKVYRNQDDTIKFQNYELFSSNTLIPIPQQMHAAAAPMATGTANGLHNHHPQAHHQQKSMYTSHSPQQQQMFFDLGSSSHSSLQQSALPSASASAVSPAQQQQQLNDHSNTVFINQLTEHWVPNMSGTYSPFGEPQPSQHSVRHLREPSDIVPEQFQPTLLHQQQMPINAMDPVQPSPSAPQVMAMATGNLSNDALQNSGEPSNLQQPSSSSPATNGSFLQLQHEEYAGAQKVTTPPKKPRMVAEVKPMRKTYADVVSKNVLPAKDDEAAAAAIITANGGAVGGSQAPTVSSNVETVAGGPGKSGTSSKLAKDNKGKQHASHDTKRNPYEDRATAKNGSAQFKDATKSANKPSSATTAATAEDRNKSPDNDSSRSFIAGRNNKKNANQASSSKASSTQNKPKSSASTSNDDTYSAAKKKSSPASTSDQEFDEDSTASSASGGAPKSSGCFLYNICKNEQSSKGAANAKRAAQSKQAGGAAGSVATAAASSASSSSGGVRANASKSERFTAYMHRRQQRSSRQPSRYDLVLKVLEKWLELVLRFVLWLFDLVSDVVLLSASMLWDASKFVFAYSKHLYEVARQELRQNSGKPTAICKAWLMQFDKQFGGESRWAVWRRFVKKQAPPAEQVRCGRLPTTGDEAMYSLLNCKGKDAYSILGVAADCSLEQLRKHYKKIAVLVHPDKNKQAGAEEAFKILQRAFELIGEPEARAAYDQSLAEALNAEKACSEINELLTQLQSKFAEAANTIRCSSCGQRHPRRPTGRPHFAARECSSCKIRHTAREGDIWAETTLFGLRWKYLALMEGKVFDITEWANCQKGALSHLQPNSHIVQYRIVLGNQQQQQQQPNQQQQQAQQQAQQQQANAGDRLGGKHANSEPSLDDFLDNLYSGQNPLGQSQPSGRRRGGRKN